MAESGAPRIEVADERQTVLRATWHGDEEVYVLSLWRDGLCIGTFHADSAGAATVSEFLRRSHPAAGPGVDGRAANGSSPDPPAPGPMPDGPRHDATAPTQPVVDPTRLLPRVPPDPNRRGLADTA